MQKRTKSAMFTSPIGTFVYPSLDKPDYGTAKFPIEGGQYKVLLRLSAKEGDVLAKQLATVYEAALKEGQERFDEMSPAQRRKFGEMKVAALFTEEFDRETEEPTGNVLFSFKTKASGKAKDGTPWNRKPALFDAKGKPMPAGVAIWGGTRGRISFSVRPYFVDGQATAGMKLQLEAAQIIDLVGPGQRAASGYGFGEEEGFDSAGFEAAASEEEASAPQAAASGGDEDF
jgi:hypothetical protein